MSHHHLFGSCIGFGATCFGCGKGFDRALKDGDFNRERREDLRYDNLMGTMMLFERRDNYDMTLWDHFRCWTNSEGLNF